MIYMAFDMIIVELCIQRHGVGLTRGRFAWR